MKNKYLLLSMALFFFLILFSATSLALIPGDFGSANNGPPDGCVDFEDLMIFAMAYGTTPSDSNWNPLCDIAGLGSFVPDGIIDFEDLMIFALHYGECECTLPSAPTLSDPGDTLSSPATYTVSWTAVSGATSYVLQEDTSSSFSGAQEYTLSGTSKSFSHIVTTTTTYYYRAAAINDCGQSDWSDIEDITVVIVTGPVHNLTKDTYYNIIQAALDDAGDGNIIEVADGTYEESITSPFGKVIILQSANGNPYLAIIQGDSGFPTVKIDGSADGTTIKGFTITHADGLIGRGIYNTNNSNININNCTISGNTANYGGGIDNDGTLTITSSTISGNSAANGGGIYNYSTGTLTITSSTISGNTAADSDNTTTDFGGGIFNVGILDITSSTISDNTTADWGGGIYNVGSTLDITSSTISGNTANSGGGILNSFFGSTLSITSSDISGNTANWGGGIYNNGTFDITSSTISGNTANRFGGGIYNYGTFDITSSTISDNSAANSGGGICDFSFGGTSTITSSDISGNTATSRGGGIRNSSTLTITSSTTISGNTANSGGGIHNDGTLTIEEGSTISDNSATTFGGGIGSVSGTLTVTSSTISANTADDGGGIYNYGGTITITSSDISENSAIDDGGGIYIALISGTITIGGSDSIDTDNFNTFTDNKKDGTVSADQHICNSSGDCRSSYPYNYYNPES